MEPGTRTWPGGCVCGDTPSQPEARLHPQSRPRSLQRQPPHWKHRDRCGARLPPFSLLAVLTRCAEATAGKEEFTFPVGGCSVFAAESKLHRCPSYAVTLISRGQDRGCRPTRDQVSRDRFGAPPSAPSLLQFGTSAQSDLQDFGEQGR